MVSDSPAPGYDQAIKLWDTRTNRELLTLRGHTHGVNAVSWSPDGRRLVSASADSTIKVWDTQTGRETLTLRGHTGEVGGVSWSPDGRRLASAGMDGAIRIWDVSPGFAAERSPLLLPELERRLAADSHRLADLQLRAETLARLGRWEQAAADWTEAAKLQGDEAPLWFQAGWWVAGPFPTDASFPGESAADIDPVQPMPEGSHPALRWRAVVPTADGGLDLRPLDPGAEKSVGVLVRVYSPREQPVAALLHGATDLSFWLNGRPEHDGPRPSDEEGVPVTLRAGWNTLLFRVVSAPPRIAFACGSPRRWQTGACSWNCRPLGRGPDAGAGRPGPGAQPACSAAPGGALSRRHADGLRRLGQREQAAAEDREARSCYERLLALHPDDAGVAGEFAELPLPRLDHWEVLEPVEMASAGGTTLEPQPDGSILASGKKPLPETCTITARTRLPTIAAVRLEVLPDPSLPRHGPGRALNGNFHLDEFRLTAAGVGSPQTSRPVIFRAAWADFFEPGWPVTAVLDGNPATGWSVHPKAGRPHVAVFEVKDPLHTANGTILTFTLEQHYRDEEWQEHNMGRFRLSVTADPRAVLEEQVGSHPARVQRECLDQAGCSLLSARGMAARPCGIEEGRGSPWRGQRLGATAAHLDVRTARPTLRAGQRRRLDRAIQGVPRNGPTRQGLRRRDPGGGAAAAGPRRAARSPGPLRGAEAVGGRSRRLRPGH